jgi:hypothetical protein
MDVNNIFKGKITMPKKKNWGDWFKPPVLCASLACNMKVKIIITL